GIALSLDQTDFTCANAGDNQVTLVATDASGHSASCSTTLTVIDNIAPNLICPGNIVQALAPGACDAVVTYGDPIVTDNCSARWTKTEGPNSGDVFSIGLTQLSFKAADPSGNTTSCSFSVTLTSDQKDSDGDGIVNNCDNCPQDPN